MESLKYSQLEEFIKTISPTAATCKTASWHLLMVFLFHQVAKI